MATYHGSWFCRSDARTLLLACVAACGPARRESAVAAELLAREELPGPSWRVVARRDGKVLLAANRLIRRGIRRRADPDPRANALRATAYPTRIFENGQLRDGPVARAMIVALPHDRQLDTLLLYSVPFEGRQVLFAQAGEAPPLHESPVDPGVYIVERGERLWLLTPAGPRQLTADTVNGIARDTLWSQQREGVRSLTWAASPLWSPDGSAIAYVTNRTWMLDPRRGQEVWIVEPGTRRERPLLSVRGEFFSAQGWLRSEVVYAQREGPISAIDIGTGARRAIAVGAVVTISPSRPRLLYMTPVGDTSVRAHVVMETGVATDIPYPIPGERLDYRGAFSPSGDRILLGTSFARDSGVTRALYVFDVATRRLTRLMQWSHREGRRHPDGSPGVWLDESTVLLTQFDRSTGLESSVLLRLGGATRWRKGPSR